MSVKNVMEEYHKRYTSNNQIAPWNKGFINGYKKGDRWFYRRPGKPNVDFDDRNFRKMNEILDNEGIAKLKTEGRWGGKKTRRLKTKRKSRRFVTRKYV
jgi:hypothetical protein